MKLPADYLALIGAALPALRSIGHRAREHATRSPNRLETWLVVRDIEGLGDRLASLDDSSWRTGFGHLTITGQDVGALDDLLRGVDGPVAISDAERRALAPLREFLGRYLDGEYERLDRQPKKR